MTSYYAIDATDACVSPPAAQAATHHTHPTNSFACCEAATTDPTLLPQQGGSRPRTGHVDKPMRDHPFYDGGTSAPSSDCGSPRDQQRGGTAISVPITANIQPPAPRVRLDGSPVPPLVTDDGFMGLQTTVPHISITAGSGGGTAMRNASCASSGASSTASAGESYPLGSLPPSQMYNGHGMVPGTGTTVLQGTRGGSQESTTHFTPTPSGSLPPFLSNVSSAAGGGMSMGQHGALPGMQPTLRGIATTGHPTAPRNTQKQLPRPSPPPANPTWMQHTGGGAGRGAMGMNGMTGMPTGPYGQHTYPYMMPGGMNGGYGLFGLQNNTNSNMSPMLSGTQQPYGGSGGGGQGSYPGTYLSAAPYYPNNVMGGPLGNGVVPMYYGGNNYMSNLYGNGNNSSSSNISSRSTGGSAGSGGNNSSLPIPVSSAQAPYGAMHPQSQPGSYQMDGNAYGSMNGGGMLPAGGTMGPMVGQPSFLKPYGVPSASGAATGGQPTERPKRHGVASANKNPRSSANPLAAPRPAPSFQPPPRSSDDEERQDSRRQPSKASLPQSKRSATGCAEDEGEEMLLLSVSTAEPLSLSVKRPASKKSARPTVQQRQQREPSEQRRTSSWFASPTSSRNAAPVFSALETVQHDRRRSSRSGSSASPDIPQLRSQRSNSFGGSQRRVSDNSQSCSNSDGTLMMSTSKPGIFRRIADQCRNIGRGAANELRGRHSSQSNGQQRQNPQQHKYHNRSSRHHRDDVYSISPSASSVSSADSASTRSSFYDDDEEEWEDDGEEERSFLGSDESSEDYEEGAYNARADNNENWNCRRSSPNVYGSVRSRSSVASNVDVSIAQRRRVRVKSLDPAIINLALQERRG